MTILTTKACFETLAIDLLTEYKWLQKIADHTRKSLPSFFLNNDNITQIDNRTNLIKQLLDGMLIKDKRSFPHYLSSANSLEVDKAALMTWLNEFTEAEMETNLNGFLSKAETILDTTQEGENALERRELPQHRSALMEHSFNPLWFFNFLSKAIKNIQEALGLKTSSEKLLNESTKTIRSFKEELEAQKAEQDIHESIFTP